VTNFTGFRFVGDGKGGAFYGVWVNGKHIAMPMVTGLSPTTYVLNGNTLFSYNAGAIFSMVCYNEKNVVQYYHNKAQIQNPVPYSTANINTGGAYYVVAQLGAPITSPVVFNNIFLSNATAATMMAYVTGLPLQLGGRRRGHSRRHSRSNGKKLYRGGKRSKRASRRS